MRLAGRRPLRASLLPRGKVVRGRTAASGRRPHGGEFDRPVSPISPRTRRRFVRRGLFRDQRRRALVFAARVDDRSPGSRQPLAGGLDQRSVSRRPVSVSALDEDVRPPYRVRGYAEVVSRSYASRAIGLSLLHGPRLTPRSAAIYVTLRYDLSLRWHGGVRSRFRPLRSTGTEDETCGAPTLPFDRSVSISDGAVTGTALAVESSPDGRAWILPEHRFCSRIESRSPVERFHCRIPQLILGVAPGFGRDARLPTATPRVRSSKGGPIAVEVELMNSISLYIICRLASGESQYGSLQITRLRMVYWRGGQEQNSPYRSSDDLRLEGLRCFSTCACP